MRDRRLLALGVAGTCLYAIQSGEHVSKLRNDITSPGGTTGLCLFLKSTLMCHGFECSDYYEYFDMPGWMTLRESMTLLREDGLMLSLRERA